ncbi:hypothetical protein BVRB_037380, partial [Beta vulgaris subsp. vulgaris]
MVSWAEWLDLIQHLLSEPYDKISRKGMEFLLNIADLDQVQHDIAQSDLIDRIFASVVRQ